MRPGCLDGVPAHPFGMLRSGVDSHITVGLWLKFGAGFRQLLKYRASPRTPPGRLTPGRKGSKRLIPIGVERA